MFFFFLNFGFIYFLFMAVLGLRFCARAFSICGKWGPLFIAVRGPLIIAASLVAEHRLQTRRLSNCGSQAQLLRGVWDLPRPGLEPVSPALAGRFSTTAPPGKPNIVNVFAIRFSLMARRHVMFRLYCCHSGSPSLTLIFGYWEGGAWGGLFLPSQISSSHCLSVKKMFILGLNSIYLNIYKNTTIYQLSYLG